MNIEEEDRLSHTPRVQVTFANSAHEEVGFLMIWTFNGQATTQEQLNARIYCPIQNSWNFSCEAIGTLKQEGHPTVRRVSQLGFRMRDLEFDSQYCFKLKTVNTDSVISGDWSNEACVRTPKAPPIPAAPSQGRVSYLPATDGRNELGKPQPPRALLEWVSDGIAVERYTVQSWDRAHNRWIDADVYNPLVSGLVTKMDAIPPNPYVYDKRSPDYESTIALTPTSVVTDLQLYRVCARNLMGAACGLVRKPVILTGTRVDGMTDVIKSLRPPVATSRSASMTPLLPPPALASATARTAAVLAPSATATVPPAMIIPAGSVGGPRVLYGVNAAGELLWFGQDAATSALSAPRVVASGWGAFRDILPAGGSSLYGLTPDGVLKWYRHDGFVDGSARWTGPVDVGTGWQSFKQVVAAGDGVLYGIGADGQLRWYRQTDAANPSGRPTWVGPNVVGYGWGGFQHLFSGGGGTLYGVTADGQLMWYRHKGYLNGTFAWDGPKPVATGWGEFKTAVSPGQGLIYAVKPSGEVLLYTHLGYGDGTPRWQGPVSLGAATAPDLTHLMPMMWNTSR